MKRFILTVELLEDLHTGSGTGTGEYDALIRRGRDGRPMIPASHWQGVWRDNLSRYLASLSLPPTQCDFLFGKANKGRGALSATGLYLKEKATADTLPWTSSAREPDSRVPLDNTLHTREYLPAGTVLHARLWLADEALIETLHLACRLTDALGSRRRRGGGRIFARLTECRQSQPAAQTTDLPAPALAYIRLLLRAEDSLCLPVTGYPGNIIPSECYLRGQVLRSAIIAWLRRSGRQETAKRLANPDICFDNAYPLPAAAVPGDEDEWHRWEVVPMPLNFNFPKPGDGEGNGWPWWASEGAPAQPVDRFTASEGGEKLKRPADSAFLFSVDGHIWQSFSAPLSDRLRMTVPSAEHPDGALFAQQEIPEKTLLLGDIRFPDKETAENVLTALQPVLSGDDCLTIGRGGAPLTIRRWAGKLPSDEIVPAETASALTLTLTADLIARSSTLGFYTALAPSVLFELCGMTEQDCPEAKNRRVQSYCDQVEAYGFNAMTGLPRLPALAIRRGSAVRIEGDGLGLLKERLSRKHALGERMHEGFGRFRLDFNPTIAAAGRETRTPSVNEAERLYAKAEEAFLKLPKQTETWPRLSQWQALRFNATDGGLPFVELIKQHKKRLEGKDKARIAWFKPGPEEKSWIGWLITQLEEMDTGQQRLFYQVLLGRIRRKLKSEEGADAG